MVLDHLGTLSASNNNNNGYVAGVIITVLVILVLIFVVITTLMISFRRNLTRIFKGESAHFEVTPAQVSDAHVRRVIQEYYVIFMLLMHHFNQL